MAEQSFKLVRADEDPGAAAVELVVADGFDLNTMRGPCSLRGYDVDGNPAEAKVAGYGVEHIPGLGGKVTLTLYFTATEVTK